MSSHEKRVRPDDRKAQSEVIGWVQQIWIGKLGRANKERLSRSQKGYAYVTTERLCDLDM